MDLKGKRMVITGASSGIGRELTALAASRGAEVVAAARDMGGAFCGKEGIHTAEYDLRVPANVDALIDCAYSKLGGIDVFIANAGMGYYGKTPADWDHVEDIFRLNVFSPVYALTRLCELQKGGGFRFVAMDSGAGRIPLPGYSLYCSTKFALDGFMRAFRFELPDNVKLSVVFPVSVDTDFFDKAAEDAPPPRPVRPVRSTAKKILRGIEEEKDEIYPSRVFPFLTAVNRFCPKIETAYQNSEKNRFGDWLRNHG